MSLVKNGQQKIEDLRALADDAILIMERLARAEDDSSEAKARSEQRPTPSVNLSVALRKYLRMRRSRDQLLPGGWFADPAWDILLDLYLADLDNRKIYVSSACIAAAVPSTTGLRWIAKLESSGLIVRYPDQSDQRRFWLALTDQTRYAIGQWAAETFLL